MTKKTVKIVISSLTLIFILSGCAKYQEAPIEIPEEPVETAVETPVETPVEAPVEAPVEDEKEPEEIVEEITEEPVEEKVEETPASPVKETFTIKNMTGKSLSDAKSALSIFNLKIVEEHSDSVGKGLVITQNPKSGEKEKGIEVEVRVSLGKKAVAVVPKPTPVVAPKPTPTPVPTAPKPTPVIKVIEELKTEVISFSTEEKKDEILLVGETEVEREGINGERTLKYKVTLTDGKETGRELISNTVAKEPVNKVVKVGTRVYVSYDEKMTKYLPAGYSFGEGGWPYALGGNGIYKGDKFVAGVSFNVLNMDSNLSHEEQLKLAEFFVIYRGGDTIREDVINALKQYHEHGGFGKSGLVSCTWGEFVVQIYYSNAG